MSMCKFKMIDKINTAKSYTYLDDQSVNPILPRNADSEEI